MAKRQGTPQLTKQEQANVRAALRVLKVRDNGFGAIARKVGVTAKYLETVFYAMSPASALLAIRLSQLAGAPIDDVLAGRYPGKEFCRHCGHPVDDGNAKETPDVH